MLAILSGNFTKHIPSLYFAQNIFRNKINRLLQTATTQPKLNLRSSFAILAFILINCQTSSSIHSAQRSNIIKVCWLFVFHVLFLWFAKILSSLGRLIFIVLCHVLFVCCSFDSYSLMIHFRCIIFPHFV